MHYIFQISLKMLLIIFKLELSNLERHYAGHVKHLFVMMQSFHQSLHFFFCRVFFLGGGVDLHFWMSE